MRGFFKGCKVYAGYKFKINFHFANASLRERKKTAHPANSSFYKYQLRRPQFQPRNQSSLNQKKNLTRHLFVDSMSCKAFKFSGYYTLSHQPSLDSWKLHFHGWLSFSWLDTSERGVFKIPLFSRYLLTNPCSRTCVFLDMGLCGDKRSSCFCPAWLKRIMQAFPLNIFTAFLQMQRRDITWDSSKEALKNIEKFGFEDIELLFVLCPKAN